MRKYFLYNKKLQLKSGYLRGTFTYLWFTLAPLLIKNFATSPESLLKVKNSGVWSLFPNFWLTGAPDSNTLLALFWNCYCRDLDLCHRPDPKWWILSRWISRPWRCSNRRLAALRTLLVQIAIFLVRTILLSSHFWCSSVVILYKFYVHMF